MEIAAIAALGGVCVAGVAIITFWINLSDRISKADLRATSADEGTKACAVQVAAIHAAFGLYRETVAREYIHRESMREMEDRLTAAIDRLADRLDRILDKRSHDE